MHSKGKSKAILMVLAACVAIVSVLIPQPAAAATGDLYLLTCPNCQSVSDFENVAGAAAAQRQQGGLYLVISQGSAMTGWVRVAGTPATTCTPDGECRGYLKIYSITSQTASGAPANKNDD